MIRIRRRATPRTWSRPTSSTVCSPTLSQSGAACPHPRAPEARFANVAHLAGLGSDRCLRGRSRGRVIELHDWIRSTSFEPKPWLLLGKGPTFGRRGEFPLADYNLIGLNDVVAEQKLEVAHIIDLDVVANCAEVLKDNCSITVLGVP